MKELELGGLWDLKPVERFDGRYEDGGAWLTQEQPAHWQQLRELEYYTGKVVYRKRFSFMPDDDKRYWLKLNGVFYWATAYLNGCRLGANEGYFFPAIYEITEIIEAENELLLEVDCPAEPDKTDKHMVTGVFHHWDCIDPETNPGGIWLPVEIISTKDIAIRSAGFDTVYFTPDYARVETRVELDSVQNEDCRLRISLVPKTFEGASFEMERNIKKPAGVQGYVFTMDVKDYRLWWTHDHGRPDLYTATVEVLKDNGEKPDDSLEQAFGIRTFHVRDYICRLNGKRMFVRGNNYPPGDTRIATMNRSRYERDLDLARECNLNMLRVHAHVEHPVFYEVCDEKGMLIWQDFPLQWYYRDDIEPAALHQLEKMIEKLGSHPCVGIWCMHNEPIRQFDLHKKIKALDVIRWLFSIFIWNRNREIMDKKLEARAKHLSPYTYVHRSSGERGLFRKDPGDGHWYFGWYFGPLRWLDYFVKKKPHRLKFVTEFGSQSFPVYESCVRFMPGELDKLDWKKLEKRHHLQERLLKLWVNPKRYLSLREYIEATQDYQSGLNRYYIDRLRSLKYSPCGGCVAFVLLDSNPAIQWSVLDYWRVPKKSYYSMRDCMSPVYAFALPEKSYRAGKRINLPVYAVNDTWKDVEAGLKVIIKAGNGREHFREEMRITLTADCKAVPVCRPAIYIYEKGGYKLDIKLETKSGTLLNTYNFKVK